MLDDQFMKGEEIDLMKELVRKMTVTTGLPEEMESFGVCWCFRRPKRKASAVFVIILGGFSIVSS